MRSSIGTRRENRYWIRMPKRRTRKVQRSPRFAALAAEPLRGDAALREIYAIVRAIPRGKVATYGQIAELAGIPAGHRVVARAMRTCPDGLPWQRVVGKKDARRAQIVVQEPEHVAVQRKKLSAERVSFDDNGFIVLKKFGWLEA